MKWGKIFKWLFHPPVKKPEGIDSLPAMPGVAQVAQIQPGPSAMNPAMALGDEPTSSKSPAAAPAPTTTAGKVAIATMATARSPRDLCCGWRWFHLMSWGTHVETKTNIRLDHWVFERGSRSVAVELDPRRPGWVYSRSPN